MSPLAVSVPCIFLCCSFAVSPFPFTLCLTVNSNDTCHLIFWFVSPVNWSQLGSDTCKARAASLRHSLFECSCSSLSASHVSFIYSLLLFLSQKLC